MSLTASARNAALGFAAFFSVFSGMVTLSPRVIELWGVESPSAGELWAHRVFGTWLAAIQVAAGVHVATALGTGQPHTLRNTGAVVLFQNLLMLRGQYLTINSFSTRGLAVESWVAGVAITILVSLPLAFDAIWGPILAKPQTRKPTSTQVVGVYLLAFPCLFFGSWLTLALPNFLEFYGVTVAPGAADMTRLITYNYGALLIGLGLHYWVTSTDGPVVNRALGYAFVATGAPLLAAAVVTAEEVKKLKLGAGALQMQHVNVAIVLALCMGSFLMSGHGKEKVHRRAKDAQEAGAGAGTGEHA
jgi:hypothetical protein